MHGVDLLCGRPNRPHDLPCLVCPSVSDSLIPARKKNARMLNKNWYLHVLSPKHGYNWFGNFQFNWSKIEVTGRQKPKQNDVVRLSRRRGLRPDLLVLYRERLGI